MTKNDNSRKNDSLALQNDPTKLESAAAHPAATAGGPSELDRFLMECNSVCSGRLQAIAGLRARSERTGLSLAHMRLAADAASVKVVRDGRELKVVPLVIPRPLPES
ncbi:hypothetical protein [Massilia sp.]|uniref:hypothetical protein n=1 Tax=Massilia sp. TaxID=1882437 RepID=UPI00352D829C